MKVLVVLVSLLLGILFMSYLYTFVFNVDTTASQDKFRLSMHDDISQKFNFIEQDFNEKLVDTRAILMNNIKQQLTETFNQKIKSSMQDLEEIINVKMKERATFKPKTETITTKLIPKQFIEKVSSVKTETITTKLIPKQSIEKAISVKGVQNLCNADVTFPLHQKLLSYAVYGPRKLYYEGIPLVIKEAKESYFYKDWYIRIYHDKYLSPEIKETYKNNEKVQFCDASKVLRYGNQTNILGIFWRTIPMADPSVDIVCMRDLDSALYKREADAVFDWVNSKKIMHVMRDHRQHNVEVMAGMWCFRPELNRSLSRTTLENLLEKAKGTAMVDEQILLRDAVYFKIDKNYILQHDSSTCWQFPDAVPFPTQKLDNFTFVGCPGHHCNWPIKPCPIQCRPKNHQDWEYC